MINPAELVNNLVAHLHDIPELVAETRAIQERLEEAGRKAGKEEAGPPGYSLSEMACMVEERHHQCSFSEKSGVVGPA